MSLLECFDFVWNTNGLMEFLADSSDDLYKAVKNALDTHKEVSAIKNTETGKGLFLGTKLYDNDFLKLIVRFSIHLISLLVIVRLIYYPVAKRKDYLFTYIMISLIIFFICFTLKKFDLGLGMALGLFAIFGIIRYRTDPMPIKEMTYLFIIIGLTVINSLSNKQMSYTELLFTNFTTIFATFGMERLWLLKHESRKILLYERIELIVPQRQEELIQDIEQRTGLKIARFEIGKIDFLRDTVQIIIYYYDDEQEGNFRDEGLGFNN
ncbi:MAG: DUF4956 domain-containing protein [Flavobacteriales bacterium]